MLLLLLLLHQTYWAGEETKTEQAAPSTQRQRQRLLFFLKILFGITYVGHRFRANFIENGFRLKQNLFLSNTTNAMTYVGEKNVGHRVVGTGI